MDVEKVLELAERFAKIDEVMQPLTSYHRHWAFALYVATHYYHDTEWARFERMHDALRDKHDALAKDYKKLDSERTLHGEYLREMVEQLNRVFLSKSRGSRWTHADLLAMRQIIQELDKLIPAQDLPF